MPMPPEEPPSCPICIEPYKGKKVVQITCQYCPSHACRGCQQRYLTQTFEDPHCMECKRGWGPEFMAANFPLSFRNDTLRKHRRRILLEREKATLPAMQVFVEYFRERERLAAEMKAARAVFGGTDGMNETDMTISARFGRANRAYRAAELVYYDAQRAVRQLKEAQVFGAISADSEEGRLAAQRLKEGRAARKAAKAKLEELRPAWSETTKEYYEAVRKMNDLARRHWRADGLYRGVQQPGGEGGGEGGAERREFIMKCPDEGCRGFLSSAYKCGTCEKWTCTQCLVVLGLEKGGEHVCNPDTVATAKAIKAETRPCPKCGTRIFKTEGCDQMFCTMADCHTAFSWTSGKIVTGLIHNPHYYEWLRRNGGGAPAREMGDIPCGGLPAYWQLMGQFRNHQVLGDVSYPLMEIHRNLAELIDARLRDFPARPPANANKDVDVQYLLQRIDQDEWQRQLEFAEARFKRKREIGQILHMAATTGSDMMRTILTKFTTEPEGNDDPVDWLVSVATPGLEQLRLFVNDSLKALGKRERMAVPQLGEGWAYQPMRALYKPKKVEVAALPAAGQDAPEDGVEELPEEVEVLH